MKTTVAAKLAVVLMLLSTQAVLAAPTVEEYQGVKAITTSDLEPGETVVGQRFDYPRGRPLISTHELEIQPGETTSWHYHAIPVITYVISGDVKTDYGPEGARTFTTGDSYVEAINRCHSIIAMGTQPARIYSVFLSKQRGDQTQPSACDKPE